jgi:hypothetical protein
MLAAQNEVFLGGGDELGMARLIFAGFGGLDIPCTHTEIAGDFRLDNGLSMTTFVERCEFRVSKMNGAVPTKNVPVTLMVNSTTPLALKLGSGGLMPGGEIYRFMLVDIDFNA